VVEQKVDFARQPAQSFLIGGKKAWWQNGATSIKPMI
jgi:hypothetical protein